VQDGSLTTKSMWGHLDGASIEHDGGNVIITQDLRLGETGTTFDDAPQYTMGNDAVLVVRNEEIGYRGVARFDRTGGSPRILDSQPGTLLSYG